jgi:hypothetical protein
MQSTMLIKMITAMTAAFLWLILVKMGESLLILQVLKLSFGSATFF